MDFISQFTENLHICVGGQQMTLDIYVQFFHWLTLTNSSSVLVVGLQKSTINEFYTWYFQVG